MLLISDQQLGELDKVSRQAFINRQALWLRTVRVEYVDDLDDSELLELTTEIIQQSHILGLTDEVSIRAIAAVGSVYGAYAHIDPLFESVFYAELPRGQARIFRSPQGIWDALAGTLNVEFGKRTGVELVIALGEVFLDEDTRPDYAHSELLGRYFPERAGRLSDAQISAHLALADEEASRLGLRDARARRYYQDVGLLLGAAFGREPLYPWARAAFDHEGDDIAKISRLRSALRRIVQSAQTRMEGD